MTDARPETTQQLDETARSVAETWADMAGVGKEDSSFDKGRSLRLEVDRSVERTELVEALSRLPRIDETRDDELFSDIHYREVIGRGGMATIRSATQVPVGREVAVKEVREGAPTTDGESRSAPQGLLQEAWVTGYLEHPNIVPIYRVGRGGDDRPVIVMKRIEGVSWAELLEDPNEVELDIQIDDALQWHLETLVQVCNAVEYAHSKGVLHRDLKPENVMVGEFGEVYVVDWGIAGALEPIDDNARIPTLDDLPTAVGTPAFIAPETIRGEVERIDERSDVYLLGGMLHVLLTGESPHEGSTILQVLEHVESSGGPSFDDDVPRPLADICTRALAVDPADRFPSVADFREALQDFSRHRESMAISAEAAERLEGLESRDDFRNPDPSDEPDLVEEIAACRFGFEQAIEMSDRNESARRGLQRLLEQLVERELERGGFEAASHFLADLPEPVPALEERVEMLRRKRESRREEIRELRERERERDVDVGRHARSLFVLVVGALTAGLNLLPRLWEVVAGTEPGVGLFTFGFAGYAGAVGALLYYARDDLAQNRANRRMVLALLVVLAADGYARILVATVGAAGPVVAANKAILVGACLSVLAVALDRRLFWTGGTFALVAPLQLAFPNWIPELGAAGSLVGTSLLAWAWWESDG